MELNARRTAPLQKKKKKLDVAAFGSQSWGRGGRESEGSRSKWLMLSIMSLLVLFDF